MIVVKLPSKQVALTFRHPVVDSGRRATICRILEQEPDVANHWTMLSEGRVECSQQNNFNKEVGRKLALERALLRKDPFGNKCFGKNDRRIVWEHYFCRGLD